jgi:hypothetical protein
METVKAVRSNKGTKIHMESCGALLCTGNRYGTCSSAGQTIQEVVYAESDNFTQGMNNRIAAREELTNSMRMTNYANDLCIKCFGKAGA